MPYTPAFCSVGRSFFHTPPLLEREVLTTSSISSCLPATPKGNRVDQGRGRQSLWPEANFMLNTLKAEIKSS